MKGLNDSRLPKFGLVASLIKAMPNRFDELILTMKMGWYPTMLIWLKTQQQDYIIG